MKMNYYYYYLYVICLVHMYLYEGQNEVRKECLIS